jgi:hypothetical protein
MDFLRWYLWIAPNVLLGIFLVRLLYVRLARQFPALVAYVAFELTVFFALLVVVSLIFHSMSSIDTYRWILLFGVACGSALQLLLIYQIANTLLSSQSSLARILRSTLRWTGVGLVLLSVSISAMFSQNGIRHVIHMFEVVNFSTYVINLGILIVLLVFTRVLRISWRSFPAGVVLGLGINASVEIAATSLVSALGPKNYAAIDILRMSAFHLCVVVWLIYSFLPRDSRQAWRPVLQPSEMEHWDKQMQRMMQP